MLSDRHALLTLHRWWLVGTVAVIALAIVCYASLIDAGRPWPGGSSPVGLAYGVIAAAIIVFECALVLRRTWWFRTFRWFGSAQLWMKAHIWLGLLAVPLVVMHSGCDWGGWLSTLVAGSFALVTASGIFGLAMQTILPRVMLGMLPEETIHAQIDKVAAQLAADARRLVGIIDDDFENNRFETPALETVSALQTKGFVVSGLPRQVGTMVERIPRPEREVPVAASMPPALQEAVRDVIDPFLQTGQSLRHGLHTKQRCEWYFEELRRRIEAPEAQTIIDALERFCDRRRQMNLQRRLHFWLHGWLHIHVPLAAILLALLVGHIVFAWRYS